jgi:hypothetical protein
MAQKTLEQSVLLPSARKIKSNILGHRCWQQTRNDRDNKEVSWEVTRTGANIFYSTSFPSKLQELVIHILQKTLLPHVDNC